MDLKKTLAVARIAGMVILAAAFMPTQGHAKITSSMTASCIGLGGSCSTVRFVLSLPENYVVEDLQIFTIGSGGWQFKTAAEGGNAYFGGNAAQVLTGNQLSYAWGGDPYDQGTPLFIVADIKTIGSAALAGGGAFRYQGDGNTPDPCYPDEPLGEGSNCDLGYEDTSFGGTVTPEPMTVTLLLSGLAGVAGVHRRRRKGDLG